MARPNWSAAAREHRPPEEVIIILDECLLFETITKVSQARLPQSSYGNGTVSTVVGDRDLDEPVNQSMPVLQYIQYECVLSFALVCSATLLWRVAITVRNEEHPTITVAWSQGATS